MTGPSIWPYLPSAHPNGEPEPAVPVTLHGPRDHVTTEAVLDSGAECTAIPLEWAAPLGVDLDSAERKTAWGNGVLADYLFPIERLRLDIAGRTIDLQPMFGPWPHLALGRDVFKHFRITFDERTQKVILDPYPEAT